MPDNKEKFSPPVEDEEKSAGGDEARPDSSKKEDFSAEGEVEAKPDSTGDEGSSSVDLSKLNTEMTEAAQAFVVSLKVSTLALGENVGALKGFEEALRTVTNTMERAAEAIEKGVIKNMADLEQVFQGTFDMMKAFQTQITESSSAIQSSMTSLARGAQESEKMVRSNVEAMQALYGTTTVDEEGLPTHCSGLLERMNESFETLAGSMVRSSGEFGAEGRIQSFDLGTDQEKAEQWVESQIRRLEATDLPFAQNWRESMALEQYLATIPEEHEKFRQEMKQKLENRRRFHDFSWAYSHSVSAEGPLNAAGLADVEVLSSVVRSGKGEVARNMAMFQDLAQESLRLRREKEKMEVVLEKEMKEKKEELVRARGDRRKAILREMRELAQSDKKDEKTKEIQMRGVALPSDEEILKLVEENLKKKKEPLKKKKNTLERKEKALEKAEKTTDEKKKKKEKKKLSREIRELKREIQQLERIPEDRVLAEAEVIVDLVKAETEARVANLQRLLGFMIDFSEGKRTISYEDLQQAISRKHVLRVTAENWEKEESNKILEERGRGAFTQEEEMAVMTFLKAVGGLEGSAKQEAIKQFMIANGSAGRKMINLRMIDRGFVSKIDWDWEKKDTDKPADDDVATWQRLGVRAFRAFGLAACYDLGELGGGDFAIGRVTHLKKWICDIWADRFAGKEEMLRAFNTRLFTNKFGAGLLDSTPTELGEKRKKEFLTRFGLYRHSDKKEDDVYRLLQVYLINDWEALANFDADGYTAFQGWHGALFWDRTFKADEFRKAALKQDDDNFLDNPSLKNFQELLGTLRHITGGKTERFFAEMADAWAGFFMSDTLGVRVGKTSHRLRRAYWQSQLGRLQRQGFKKSEKKALEDLSRPAKPGFFDKIQPKDPENPHKKLKPTWQYILSRAELQGYGPTWDTSELVKNMSQISSVEDRGIRMTSREYVEGILRRRLKVGFLPGWKWVRHLRANYEGLGGGKGLLGLLVAMVMQTVWETVMVGWEVSAETAGMGGGGKKRR